MKKDLLNFVFTLTTFLIYFMYLLFTHGGTLGFHLTILTWCFYLLGTPIISSGLLIDFPVKYFYNKKMEHTQLLVSAMGVIITCIYLFVNPSLFQKTTHTKILYNMFTAPFSKFGLIFVLSFAGTLLSAKLVDQIYNMILFKNKKYILDNKGLFVIYLIILLVYFTIVQHCIFSTK